jgi:hypothetical protein
MRAPAGLLCVNDEGRKQADNRNDREPDPLHGHVSVGMAGESRARLGAS